MSDFRNYLTAVAKGPKPEARRKDTAVNSALDEAWFKMKAGRPSNVDDVFLYRPAAPGVSSLVVLRPGSDFDSTLLASLEYLQAARDLGINHYEALNFVQRGLFKLRLAPATRPSAHRQDDLITAAWAGVKTAVGLSHDTRVDLVPGASSRFVRLAEELVALLPRVDDKGVLEEIEELKENLLSIDSSEQHHLVLLKSTS